MEEEKRDFNTIDRKYEFVACNPCNQHVITAKNGVVFNAHDEGLPTTLMTYYKECKRLGCDQYTLDSVLNLIGRVEKFQRKNGCKPADIDLPCEVDRCVRGLL